MTLTRQRGIGLLIVVVALGLIVYGVWSLVQANDPYEGLITERPIEVDEATREYFEQRLATTLAAIEASEKSGEEVDLNLYLSAASDAYLLGDLVTAREMLELQLAGNPINYVAWNNYALVLEAMTDLEAAEAAYIKTLTLERGVVKYTEDYAKFLLEHYPERRADLLALYEDDLMRRGQTVWNMTSLGNWYAEGGDCARAIDHYEVAVVLDPTSQALKDDFSALKSSCKE